MAAYTESFDALEPSSMTFQELRLPAVPHSRKRRVVSESDAPVKPSVVVKIPKRSRSGTYTVYEATSGTPEAGERALEVSEDVTVSPELTSTEPRLPTGLAQRNNRAVSDSDATVTVRFSIRRLSGTYANAGVEPFQGELELEEDEPQEISPISQVPRAPTGLHPKKRRIVSESNAVARPSVTVELPLRSLSNSFIEPMIGANQTDDSELRAEDLPQPVIHQEPRFPNGFVLRQGRVVSDPAASTMPLTTDRLPMRSWSGSFEYEIIGDYPARDLNLVDRVPSPEQSTELETQAGVMYPGSADSFELTGNEVNEIFHRDSEGDDSHCQSDYDSLQSEGDRCSATFREADSATTSSSEPMILEATTLQTGDINDSRHDDAHIHTGEDDEEVLSPQESHVAGRRVNPLVRHSNEREEAPKRTDFIKRGDLTKKREVLNLLRNLTASLPPCYEKPDLFQVGPIADKESTTSAIKTRKTLPDELLSSGQVNRRSEKIFYFSSDTTTISWLGYGQQHAMLAGPRTQENLRYNLRIKSPFEDVYGQTRELFYTYQNALIYAGRYRCRRIEKVIDDPQKIDSLDFSLVPQYARDKMILAARHAQVPSKGQPLSTETIKRYCERDIIKFERIALQCVGFDKELYEALGGQFTGCVSDGLLSLLEASEDRDRPEVSRLPYNATSSYERDNEAEDPPVPPLTYETDSDGSWIMDLSVAEQTSQVLGRR